MNIELIVKIIEYIEIMEVRSWEYERKLNDLIESDEMPDIYNELKALL